MNVAKYYFKRVKPFLVLFIVCGIIEFLYKAVSAGEQADFAISSLFKMLLNFTWQSGTVFLFLGAGLSFYLLVMPRRWIGGRLDRFYSAGIFFAFSWLIIFSKLAEALFWQEFGVSFNFIAVDYLVYTQEVLGNIAESYPMGVILSFISIAAAFFTWLFVRSQRQQEYIWPLIPGLVGRCAVTAGLIIACGATSIIFDGSMANQVSDNRYSREIAKNEMYSFFSAFMNNRLDYAEFYIQKNPDDNLALLRSIYQADGVEFADGSLTRQITAVEPPRELNVVLVVMESLGSEFMNENRIDGSNLTPNLSSLSKKGIYFVNTYATGTRTVRGLEAVTLALPPQAGMSIIRQKNNAGLSNISTVFRERGYNIQWLYGGYGYFDNMNEFFGQNGFNVIDRTDIDEQDIHHETVWGVADEDLFTKTLLEADKSYAAGQKFFQLVMTTSNHSPYSYPEGRIDLPSKVSGRKGAVKYSDWAVGDYVARAAEKPWFNDTVFIFIADHGASSAGKQELNPDKHKIPFIIYSPQNIEPQRIERVISQIDAMPTVLGLLNFSYTAPFMGRDALKAPDDGRYFISNYQYIGYGEHDKLLILKPVREAVYYDAGGDVTQPDLAMLDKAVAYYQYASDWPVILRR